MKKFMSFVWDLVPLMFCVVMMVGLEFVCQGMYGRQKRLESQIAELQRQQASMMAMHFWELKSLGNVMGVKITMTEGTNGELNLRIDVTPTNEAPHKLRFTRPDL